MHAVKVVVPAPTLISEEPSGTTQTVTPVPGFKAATLKSHVWVAPPGGVMVARRVVAAEAALPTFNGLKHKLKLNEDAPGAGEV